METFFKIGKAGYSREAPHTLADCEKFSKYQISILEEYGFRDDRLDSSELKLTLAGFSKKIFIKREVTTAFGSDNEVNIIMDKDEWIYVRVFSWANIEASSVY